MNTLKPHFTRGEQPLYSSTTRETLHTEEPDLHLFNPADPTLTNTEILLDLESKLRHLPPPAQQELIDLINEYPQ